jgi:glycosyltransferase involved in cell wall biosynthesis
MKISLCSFIKNEESCIEQMICSVKDYVDEIVIVDTGSEDSTLDICRKYGARIYEVGFTDFGKIRTLTAHLAREPWILMLDSDETLEYPHLLKYLATSGQSDAYSFPRKRWLDLEKTRQTEIEAFPDPQVRFYKNNPNYVWRRELHEYFDGAAVTHIDHGPVINHFHDIFHTPEKLAVRKVLYERLAQLAHVTTEGGKPL